jgi:oligosaccharide translocation protein RFT1
VRSIVCFWSCRRCIDAARQPPPPLTERTPTPPEKKGSNLATRAITFSLNLLIARRLSPDAYALLAVQFHLVTAAILTLSREGFRRGCLRFSEEQGDGGGAAASPATPRRKTTTKTATPTTPTIADRVVGVAWLSFPLGVACSAVVCAVAVLGSSSRGGDKSSSTTDYAWGVALHGLAALVELFVEPLYVATTARLELGLRAGVESAAAVTRCLATLALLVLAADNHKQTPPFSPLLHRIGSSPSLTFGAAQLAAALVVAGCYAARARRLCRSGALHLRSALGRGPGGLWDAQDRAALRLSGLFGIQAAEKLVLAEGSKLALVAVSSRVRGGGATSSRAAAAQQGAYGLVSNLGGLVARLMLQPLEDVAFAAFSRAAAGIRQDQEDEGEQAAEDEAAPAASGARRRRVVAADDSTKTTKKKKHHLAATLCACSRAVSLIGALAAAAGPWYARPLLRLAYGPRWADGPGGAALALGTYASYVAVMAVNGVTEAFAHAVLDAQGLKAANAALVAFAGGQLALSAGAVAVAARFDLSGQWGAAALVAADALGMLPRVAFALACIRGYFSFSSSEGEGEGEGAGGGRQRGGKAAVAAARGAAAPAALLRLRDLFPSTASLATVVAASALAGASWRYVLHAGGGSGGGALLAVAAAPPPLSRVAAHLACGGLIAAALAPVLWRAERAALRAGAEAMRGPKEGKKGR